MSEEICDGTPRRYRVQCADGLMLVRITNDLEEAGRIYLEEPGASDIFDLDTGKFLNPEIDVPCVAKYYEEWYWRNQPWWRRILHFLFPATWDS